ncbi:hypothetical protein I3760_09G055400 [Carya illinoinensis]|uniref:Uncharacterized protein n=1 Tax=Carya illinoinensis TaxID=32201 RepID=A0A922E2K9_CARIL|nr:hypothetical protein I3760_09G055400 [Carya illinoinensis]KAG6694590.1 hypothetical protein I3842_09G056000 [Carya illinoinensis]
MHFLIHTHIHGVARHHQCHLFQQRSFTLRRLVQRNMTVCNKILFNILNFFLILLWVDSNFVSFAQ